MVARFIANAEDPEAQRGMINSINALPGFIQPSNVADACAFLLSDQAHGYSDLL